ncbi:uncharacterized protein A4U43_C08F16710 [Asparagus officinalis]|nr:uncharacterized protein A4U43_C08F16710 [Asparagus officinalis]
MMPHCGGDGGRLGRGEWSISCPVQDAMALFLISSGDASQRCCSCLGLRVRFHKPLLQPHKHPKSHSLVHREFPLNLILGHLRIVGGVSSLASAEATLLGGGVDRDEDDVTLSDVLLNVGAEEQVAATALLHDVVEPGLVDRAAEEESATRRRRSHRRD